MGATQSTTMALAPTLTNAARMEFGAGCFWGVAFLLEKEFPALARVRVGYQGGTTANPTYEQVCAKYTKHVEVVQCEWEEGAVDLDELITFFYRCVGRPFQRDPSSPPRSFHDPTTVDRQHNDVGNNYRSVIFYHGAAQKAAAERVTARMQSGEGANGRWKGRVVTTIEDGDAHPFWVAEDYHQDYLKKNPGGYCPLRSSVHGRGHS